MATSAVEGLMTPGALAWAVHEGQQANMPPGVDKAQ
jgi:hypothetical protein